MKFLDLYDSIVDYFDKREIENIEDENFSPHEIILWIDLFCFNHHLPVFSSPALTDQYFDQLKALLAYGQYSLVIIPSWKEPLPLARTTTLLEMFLSMQTNCVVEFFMCERSMKTFLNDLKQGKCDAQTAISGETVVSPLSLFVSSLNILKSESKSPVEKEAVLKFIQSMGVGFFQFNSLLLSRTREFVQIIIENLIKVSSMPSFSTSREVIVLEEERMHIQMLQASLVAAEGDFDRAEQLYLACLSQDDYLGLPSSPGQPCGGNDFLYLRCKSKLAQLYWRTGESAKGEPLAREVYQRRLVLLGDEHPETLSAMKTLALILGEENKLAESIELHLLCLEKRKKRLGEDHSSTIQSMKNLAMVQAKASRYSEAIQMYSVCLEKAKRVFGLDHQHTLSTMTQLAALLAQRGRVDEAEAMYQELLALSRATYGENDIETIKVLSKLTNLLAEEKKYSNIELFQECFEKRKIHHSLHHIDTLKAMNNLANAQYISGKYSKGEKLYKECLELSKEMLGEDHPDSLGTMYNLANLFYKQRKYAEAEEMYERSFVLRYRSMGENHPQTLSSMASLAYIFYKQKKLKRAEDLYERLLDKQIEVLGDAHAKTLRSMIELASVYIERNKLSKAEDLLMTCFKKKRVALGDDHPETLSLMDDLGYLYFTNGKFKEAEMLLNQCLLRRTMNLGEEHADTLSSMHHLAMLYKEIGKLMEAEELIQRCLEKKKQLFGETHSSTIETTMNLASMYYTRAKYLEAEELYLHCLEKNKKLFKNEDSPFHKMILENLAKVREMIHKTNESAASTPRSLRSAHYFQQQTSQGQGQGLGQGTSSHNVSSSTLGDPVNGAFQRSYSSSPSAGSRSLSNSHSPTGRLSGKNSPFGPVEKTSRSPSLAPSLATYTGGDGGRGQQQRGLFRPTSSNSSINTQELL